MRETRTTTHDAAAVNALTGATDARRHDVTATQVAVRSSDTATADMFGAETRRINALGPVVLLTVLTTE
jgi:hypothetical protein